MSKYKHYCVEWDGLEIDENCLEIMGCLCFNNDEFKKIRDDMIDEYDKKQKILESHRDTILPASAK